MRDSNCNLYLLELPNNCVNITQKKNKHACNSSLYFYYMRAFLQEGRLKGLKIIHNLFSQLFLVGIIEVTEHYIASHALMGNL